MKPEPLLNKKKNRFPSYPNVTFYDEETISAAVEWLKQELPSQLIKQSRLYNVHTIIDEAFEDVIKRS